LCDEAGRHFDPACVEAFLTRWDEVLEIKQKIQDASSGANPATDKSDKRRLLEMLQRMEEEFAWIGITDVNGMVVAGTGGLLEGQDVSLRDYFIQGGKPMSPYHSQPDWGMRRAQWPP